MAEKKEQKRVPDYKSENQKNKSLLVMQYILKNADDEHAVTIGQILYHDHVILIHRRDAVLASHAEIRADDL